MTWPTGPNGCSYTPQPEREVTVTLETDRGRRVVLHLARLLDDTATQDFRWLVCWGVQVHSMACAFDTWQEAANAVQGRLTQALRDGWGVVMVTQGRKR